MTSVRNGFEPRTGEGWQGAVGLVTARAGRASTRGQSRRLRRDFERGSRTPVANNAQAIREALEAQGLKFMAGGVVAQALLPPVPPALKPGHATCGGSPPRTWQNGRRAGLRRARFLELVSRLIYATVGPAASLLFPSDESVQHSGWDGICTVAQGTSPIPAGVSGWELGAQRTGIKGKADSDYENRTRDPLGPRSEINDLCVRYPKPFRKQSRLGEGQACRRNLARCPRYRC